MGLESTGKILGFSYVNEHTKNEYTIKWVVHCFKVGMCKLRFQPLKPAKTKSLAIGVGGSNQVKVASQVLSLTWRLNFWFLVSRLKNSYPIKILQPAKKVQLTGILQPQIRNSFEKIRLRRALHTFMQPHRKHKLHNSVRNATFYDYFAKTFASGAFYM